MRARILKATVGAILKMEAGTLSRVSSAPSTADEDGADRNGTPLPRATHEGFAEAESWYKRFLPTQGARKSRRGNVR